MIYSVNASDTVDVYVDRVVSGFDSNIADIDNPLGAIFTQCWRVEIRQSTGCCLESVTAFFSEEDARAFKRDTEILLLSESKLENGWYKTLSAINQNESKS